MSPRAERLLGLDLGRWLSFQAIVIFHLTYALWARDGSTSIPIRGPLVWPLETYGRTLALSGFHVLFLSFFLMGFKGSMKKNLLWILLGFGVVWALLTETYPDYWDIYPFLIVAILTVRSLQRWPLRPEWVALVSATLFSIPYWRLEELWNGPNWLLTPILGRCIGRTDLGEWPLFPWIFYVTGAWSLGRVIRSHRKNFQIMSSIEITAWIFGLAITLPNMASYFHLPLGDAFGCFAFRQSPLLFWSQELWLLAWIRLSLLDRVQTVLKNRSMMTWIAHSPVNQCFFAVYFAHYPACFLVAWVLRKAGLYQEPWILAASFAILFVFVECVWRRVNANLSTT